MRKLLFLFLLAGTTISNAQQVRPANATKIYHEIEQLRHLVNVLYVAAHPDDENTRLLAWLVNDKNINTAYFSLTRGDGGQNILGSEQGAALGFIRTHELMEARKIDGAKQFFSRAIDFGFSKTYQETFKHWNDYLLTYDAVWVMRKFRPDVVICRFPPNTMAGHGQHAASAIIAAKAFKMAGDKMQYTEQLHTYPAWQPKRLLLNTYRFGDRNTTSEDQFKIAVGQYLPGFGEGSGELAGQSRSVHKSQGAGTPMVAGVQTEYFKLIDGDTLTNSLFDGIDITWGRVDRKDIGDDLKQIAADFDFTHPDASLPALLGVRKKIMEVTDDYWRKEKLGEIDQTILDCTGLLTEIYAKQPQAVAGATLPFTLHIIARSHTPIILNSINWTGSDTTLNMRISLDTLLTLEHTITIPQNTPITQPYWLSEPSTDKDLFNIPNDSLLGLPETPDNLNATLQLNIGGQTLSVQVPLSFKKLDPVQGDIVEQLRIVPDASIAFTTSLLIARADGSVDADIHLHTFKAINNGSLVISQNGTPVSTITNLNFSNNADTIIHAHLPESAAKTKDDFYLTAVLRANGKTYNQSQQLIQYNHIPTLQYFTSPYAKVLQPTWKGTAKRIGYVEGAGDMVPSILRLAGLEVDILKESDFTDAAKLKKYDAIITGIRAVSVEKKMPYWLPVLFQYVQNGGTLVMQYNNLVDLSTTKFGPYPLTISDDRVTEEDAAITFTDPTNRLLNYPNKITQADFSNWVQERGLYFASKWDDHYHTLFSMHDEGEDAKTGGTLYTKYGKGTYIYTSLSFSRQLPSGNAGAIRLFMNMLSAGK